MTADLLATLADLDAARAAHRPMATQRLSRELFARLPDLIARLERADRVEAAAKRMLTAIEAEAANDAMLDLEAALAGSATDHPAADPINAPEGT